MNFYDYSPYYQLRRKIVHDVLTRFPDHGTLTLAKKIFKENPEYFDNLDRVRDMIRYYRGQQGKKNRQTLTDKNYVRKPVSTT